MGLKTKIQTLYMENQDFCLLNLIVIRACNVKSQNNFYLIMKFGRKPTLKSKIYEVGMSGETSNALLMLSNS